MNKEKVYDTATEISGTAASAGAGAAIGTLVAGPAGTVVGAIAGSVIEKVIVAGGKEIKEKVLSKNENRKIKTVFDLAKIKIAANIESGKKLREDVFFSDKDSRSAADEILEGTLFAAQRENEELKLPYLANLYSNINFDYTISRSMANQLIKIASEISFRQIMILSVIGKCNQNIYDLPLRKVEFRGFTDYESMSIAAEIFDLYRMSLLISNTAILDSARFIPSTLFLNGMGELLFKHMELNIPLNNEIESQIVTFLTNDSPALKDEDVISAHFPPAVLG